MAEEMTLESVPWESDEAEDWESDEALLEADDSVEDIGERARRRRRSHYRPGRGVQGIALRSPDGRVRNVPFPTKLATAQETNRGMAIQEVARRTLEQRLDRLETRTRVQQKNGNSASGLAFLAIGGGLTAYGAIEAAKRAGGSPLGNWAAENPTKVAAVASVARLATSGAKFVIDGRYHRNGIGIAADIFSAAQLTTFAFASLYTPEEYVPAANKAAADGARANYPKGTLFLTQDNGEAYRLEINTAGDRTLRLIR